jgi:hypothetical protein
MLVDVGCYVIVFGFVLPNANPWYVVLGPTSSEVRENDLRQEVEILALVN